jgi:hypothetical protein
VAATPFPQEFEIRGLFGGQLAFASKAASPPFCCSERERSHEEAMTSRRPIAALNSVRRKADSVMSGPVSMRRAIDFDHR